MRLGEKHNKNADAEVVPPPHNPPPPPPPPPPSLHSCQLLIFGSGERCKLISSMWGGAPEANHILREIEAKTSISNVQPDYQIKIL